MKMVWKSLSDYLHICMRFKEWLQQEVGLNLTQSTPAPSNKTQVAKASNFVAKNTLDKFGSKLTNDLMTASSPKAGIDVVTKYAQKGMQDAKNSASSSANIAGVAGNIYKSMTGQEPKTT